MTAEERMKICKECPLYEVQSSGPVCNKSKYINKDKQTSFLPKAGYVKGCGCKLIYKTANPKSHCVVGLW